MFVKRTNSLGLIDRAWLNPGSPLHKLFDEVPLVQRVELTSRSGFKHTYEREISPSADSG